MDDVTDVIAKGIFTGILFGGSEELWRDSLVDRTDTWPRDSRNWYRCGAQDVIQALERAGYSIVKNG